MQRGVSHKSYKKASIKALLLLQGLNLELAVLELAFLKGSCFRDSCFTGDTQTKASGECQY